MKKLIAVLLIAAAGGGFYFWQQRHGKAEAAAAADTTIVPVQRGTLIQAVSSTGRVVSNLDVDIKCKASGEVIKLPYDVSDSVKKGELVLEVDPVDELPVVKKAEVQLADSQAKLAQAKQNLIVAQKNLETAKMKADANLRSAEAKARDDRSKAERRKQLFEQNSITQEDYLSADAVAIAAEADLAESRAAVEDLKAQELSLEVKRQDVKLAEGAVETDKIALEDARQRLADTKVTAPIDGVVSARTVNIGQIIASGVTNVGGGTTVLTLSDLSHIYVLAAVDESDIGRVKLGQTVRITVDAYPGMRFRGEVVRIATKGVNVSNVVTFEVKVEVTSENKKLLKPEMTANVQVIAAEKEDVLIVPLGAVQRKQDKVMATVSKGPGQTEDRPVEVGMTDGTNWEIVSGLNEGESVVVKKGEQQSRWRGDRGASGMMPSSVFGGGKGGRGPR